MTPTRRCPSRRRAEDVVDELVSASATRGELYGRAARLRTDADREKWSVRRCLPLLGWMSGLFVVGLGAGEGDVAAAARLSLVVWVGLLWWAVAKVVPGHVAVRHAVAAGAAFVGAGVGAGVLEGSGLGPTVPFVAVLVVAGTGTSVAAVRYVRRSRALRIVLSAARAAPRDPRTRRLPVGVLDPRTVTVRDAQHLPDADQVIDRLGRETQAQQLRLRILVPSLVVMVPGLLGLVLVLGPLADGPVSGLAWTGVVCGAVLLAVYLWIFLGDLSLAQTAVVRELGRVATEIDLVQRTGAQVGGRLEGPGAGYRVGRAIPLAVPAVLLVRQGLVGAVVSLGAALVVIVVVVVVLRVRSRRLVVIPLEGIGGSVLQEPVRAVRMRLEDGVLRVEDVRGRREPLQAAASTVRAVVPVSAYSWFVPPGVAVVLEEREVVLRRRDVEEEPAVRDLRRLLAPG